MQYATEENLTDQALKRWEACHSPRLREIMQSLVKHVHEFVREVDLKEDEWLTGMNWLAKTGQLSSDKRHEFILLSDVLGVSMLVDGINHRFPTGATPSTVMGPFHIKDSPELPMGTDLGVGLAGTPCFVLGMILDLNEKPIAGAKLDVWQPTPDGILDSPLRGPDTPLPTLFP